MGSFDQVLSFIMTHRLLKRFSIPLSFSVDTVPVPTQRFSPITCLISCLGLIGHVQLTHHSLTNVVETVLRELGSAVAAFLHVRLVKDFNAS